MACRGSTRCAGRRAVRFLSIEPLLEDLGTIDLAGIDWVIVGGESGPGAREMQKDWVLNIKRQCREQRVRFLSNSGGVRSNPRRSNAERGAPGPRIFPNASAAVTGGVMADFSSLSDDWIERTDLSTGQVLPDPGLSRGLVPEVGHVGWACSLHRHTCGTRPARWPARPRAHRLRVDHISRSQLPGRAPPEIRTSAPFIECVIPKT